MWTALGMDPLNGRRVLEAAMHHKRRAAVKCQRLFSFPSQDADEHFFVLFLRLCLV